MCLKQRTREKVRQSPFLLITLCIIAVLLGMEGISRFIDMQGLYDFLMGTYLTGTGFIGAYMCVQRVRVLRRQQDAN
ncbi:hypothetical protein [Thalassobacillus hwangdonensis]|uniref:Uncharacterized protein n=1 Tax=Thalassobacillus hwangdonensis TaxID=546108 RepID=A0ABW3L189_9BACI